MVAVLNDDSMQKKMSGSKENKRNPKFTGSEHCAKLLQEQQCMIDVKDKKYKDHRESKSDKSQKKLIAREPHEE